MKTYNYHLTAEKVLLESYKKENSSKSRLLCVAVMLAVSIIFCILSFSYGKLQIDLQKNIRSDGMAASVYIENGTEEMAQQLNSLSYISKIGKQKFAGKLLQQNLKYCDCAVADETGFQKILGPSYTQITGGYPKEEQDIMLSTKTLEYLGIKEPQVGMKLQLDFYWNDIFHTDGTGQQDFRLSGYFTEYQNPEAVSSVAFISEKKLVKNKITWNPCRILLSTKEKAVSGIQMERKLSEEIQLSEGQRIVSVDSAAYRAIEETMGSYGFALVLCFFLLLCMFLFVSNVLNLSMEKDLQQYGLLETIGVYPKQIVKIMVRQMTEMVLKGSLVGGLIGSFLVLNILPYILKTRYLERAGEWEGIRLFHPSFLLVGMLPAVITVGIAVFIVKRKLQSLSPLECMNYGSISLKKKEISIPSRKHRSWGHYPETYLARRYLFRNKRAFLITMISLTVGCGFALGASVMVRGVDIENRFLKEPDFKISITQEACSTLMETSPDTKNMVFFPKELLQEIRECVGESLQNEVQIQGFYPIIGKNGSKSIRLLQGAEEHSTVIQKMNSKDKEKLQSFVKKQQLTVDWETFEHGNGALLLHEHQIAESNAVQAVKQVGTEIEVYDLVPVGTEMTNLVPEKLVNCGYVDIMDEEFPDLDLCWNGKSTNILLVTEETYQALSQNLTPQTFSLQFHVDSEQENALKARFKEMIRKQNMKFQSEGGSPENLNLFQITCKSDLLRREQNYIQTSRLFLLVISGCLIFIGIMNFLNVRVTEILIRKKECILLENVGMTKKQLYRMFLSEGIVTWMALSVLLLTVGTILLCGIGWYMKTKISYFVFSYPIKEMVALLMILLTGSILVPEILYKKFYGKTNIK